MEQGKWVVEGILRVIASERRLQAGVNLGVGHHDPLGRPGGAGGVDDGHDIVVLNAGVWRRLWGGSHELAEGDNLEPEVWWYLEVVIGQKHYLFQVLQLILYEVNPVQQALVEDEDFRFGVVDDVFQHVPFVGIVDGGFYDAYLVHTEPCVDILQAVGHEDEGCISFPEAQLREPVTHAVSDFVHPAVGNLFIAPVCENFVSQLLGSLLQDVPDHIFFPLIFGHRSLPLNNDYLDV